MYIYIGKIQRRSYSLQKGFPLVKPLIIMSSTEYFMESFGPYFTDGKNNSANILNVMIELKFSALSTKC